MRRIYFIAVLSVFSFTGCEDDLITDALLAENLRFNDGTYISGCVQDGEGGSFDVTFVVSDDGLERTVETENFSDDSCANSVGTDEYELADIGYGYLKIEPNISYFSASTLIGTDAEENEAVGYSIDQVTGDIYLSEVVVLQDESQASLEFAAFIVDPQANAFITLELRPNDL